MKEILAVSGLPGLYKLVSSRQNGLFVQPLDGGKAKFCASRKHNFTPLETVAIYTMDDTEELIDVFLNIKALEDEGFELPSKSSSNEEIKEFFGEVLPDYDRDRVYISDMKKVIKWYSVLKDRDMIKKEEPSSSEEE